MGWSDLPSELLVTIAGTLTEFTDHLRFRSVCSHWRLAFKSLPLPPQLPWLLLPSDSSTAHFYSFSEDHVYPIPLPLAGVSALLGSASGWILAVQGRFRKFTFSVFNPFTSDLIILPSPNPQSSLSYLVPDTLIWDRSDTIVVAACSTRHNVFFCRITDNSWTQIESMQNSMASSIVFYNSKFYILNDASHDVVVLDGETLEQILVINPPNLESDIEAHLLVSSNELLLLVESNWMELFPCSASKFYKVYQMNLNEELEEWVEIHDIGDRAIFLDDLHCFSVEVDEKGKMRRNCIYSGSRNSSRTFSVSAFDLGNREGERIEGALSGFSVACNNNIRGEVCPPTWIVPSLNPKP